MIRHQFGQVEFASEHWFRLAATTLATLTRSAGLATPAKPRSAHLRRLDLVVDQRADGKRDPRAPRGRAHAGPRHPRRAHRPGRAQRSRRRASTSCSVGPDRRARRSSGSPACPATIRRWSCHRRMGERVVRGAARVRRGGRRGRVLSDGLLNVMAAPEFAQSDKLRRVFAALEDRRYARRARRPRRRRRRGPRVHRPREPVIGDGATSRSMLAPYGRPGRAVGVVGVLGPTRMAYHQAIGTVRFVSGLMDELIDHLYA